MMMLMNDEYAVQSRSDVIGRLCRQVTSSTDRQRHSTTANMDERLSSALNSVTVTDAADEVGFLESLSSLSMDSATHASGALSPTSLLSETSRLQPPRPYLNTTTTNMVVNDMDTSLSQLQAEESNYYMTVHA